MNLLTTSTSLIQKLLGCEMINPLNRYLVVEDVEVKTEKGAHDILIPDEAQVVRHGHAVVRLTRPNSSSSLQEGSLLVVPRHSLEEVRVGDESYFLVLESHVLGFLDKEFS